MDPLFTELWSAAKQAGPFASLLLLVVSWLARADAKEERLRAEAAEKRATAGLHAAANAINYMRISKGLAPLDHPGTEQ